MNQTKQRINLGSFIVCSLLLYCFWMLMGFPSNPASAPGRNDIIQHAIVGLPLALTVGFFFSRDFLPRNEYFIFRPVFILKFIVYLLRLAYDIFLSGVDVAKRVLRPRMDISPTVVEVDTPLKNPWTVTLNANSITLTPGTITINTRPSETGTIFMVHCLSDANVEATLSGGGFVDRIKGLYGEENL